MWRNIKKGRGIPLSREEKQSILELQERGSTQKEIAEALGRNRKTIAKFANREGRRLEAKVREQVLAQALQEHFKELTGQLKQLRERFSPCTAWNISTFDIPMPDVDLPAEPLLALPIPGHPIFVFNAWYRMYGDLDNKSNYLIQALKETHAKESCLWELWRRWDRITGSYAQAGRNLWRWLNAEIDNESLKQQGVVVKEQLPKTLMGHILLIANNDASISPNEITARRTGRDGRPALIYREISLAVSKEASALKMARLAFLRVCSDFEQHQSWSVLRDGAAKIRVEQQTLRELHRQIESELDILIFRKAFPGRCNLCPF